MRVDVMSREDVTTQKGTVDTDGWDKSLTNVGAAHGTKAPADDKEFGRGGEEGGRTATGA